MELGEINVDYLDVPWQAQASHGGGKTDLLMLGHRKSKQHGRSSKYLQPNFVKWG